MSVTQLIQDLFNEALAVAQLIAPLAAIIGFVGLGTRGGIPLWARLLFRLRGGLVRAARRSPQGATDWSS